MTYWIFGAGLIGKKVYERLNEAVLAGFIDNDNSKIGKEYCGLPIYSLSYSLSIMSHNFIDNTIIIASTYVYEIKKQLDEIGITNYIAYDDIPYEYDSYKNESQQISVKVNEVFETLKKEKSITINDIGSILLAGYNTDDMNVGCRATSEALINNLSEQVKVKDVFYRYELLDLFEDIHSNMSINQFIGYSYYIQIEEITNIKNRISEVDAVVINGEGSFIFSKKIRKDMYVFCLLMFICIEVKKPFYLVNAMISPGNDNVMNVEQLEQAVEILKYAQKICLRDKYSVEIVKDYLNNIQFIPDALFGKYSYYEMLRERPNFSINLIKDKLGLLNNRYIVMSGNSEAAYHQIKAIVSYRTLLQELTKAFNEKNGYQIVIMECCPGDRMLINLAKELNIPIVPVEMSVNIIGLILQNAQCFISGRYHPSILASLGGTPCVYMGSNSHKTVSLQDTLGIELTEYPALPDEMDCKEIIKKVQLLIEQNNRETLKFKAKKNSEMALKLSKILFGEESYNDNK